MRPPTGTELDSFDGRCLMSVVGFLFLKTRVMGLSIPFHRNFEEVNLRFYVRRDAGHEVRRGVVFIKEIVPRYGIAMLARRTYGERYCYYPMRHSIEMNETDGRGRVEYRWKLNGQWQSLSAQTDGTPQHPVAGSEEEFITEHYWGYARQRDGSTIEYQVEHPPWKVWTSRQATLTGDFTSLYGTAIAPFLAAPPRSAFVAEGSPIVVRWGRRL